MNKKLFYFSFIFLGLLLFIPNVSASTKTGINIDAHEHFNYYYEQKNGTNFYLKVRDLSSNRNSITDDFNIHSYTNDSIYNLYAFYVDDLENATIKTYNYANQSNHWHSDVTIPNNAKYVLVFVGGYNSVAFEHAQPSISIDGDRYTYTYKTYDTNVSYYSGNGNYKSEIRFYDEDGSYISGETNIYFYLQQTYRISDYSDNDSANFTYMISSCIYCNYLPSIQNKKIIVTDIIEDGEHYLIDDNDNYSGWLRKIFSLWSLDSVDVINSDLAYFKTNVIKNNFPSLKQVIDEGVKSNIPEDFSSVVLNDENLSVMLFPKDINNDDLDRDIYYQGIDVLSRHFDANDGNTKNDIIYPQIVFDLYDYNNNFKIPHNSSNLGVLTAYSFVAQKVPLSENALGHSIDNYNLTDYSYTFSLYGSSVKLSAFISYNPNAYSICIYNESNSNGCTYINPKTNQEGTLSMLQFKNILKKSTFPGETYEDRCSRLPNYDSSYNYDNNCNKTTLKDTTGSTGIFNNLEDIGEFLNSFKSIISTIFSFVILLLDSLPVEIKSVLLFGLIAGTIITLYKIIRG